MPGKDFPPSAPGSRSRRRLSAGARTTLADVLAVLDLADAAGARLWLDGGWGGATAWNFLLGHPDGPVVDLHVVVLDAEGNGVLGPVEAGCVYPAAALTGRGSVGGRAVDCVAAEWVVRFHDGYAGDENDRRDVRALCERFGVAVPEQYR